MDGQPPRFSWGQHRMGMVKALLTIGWMLGRDEAPKQKPPEHGCPGGLSTEGLR